MRSSFSMFDFAPVGIVRALLGLLFICLLGWQFLPKRNTQETEQSLFHIENYITEVVVGQTSKLVGLPIARINTLPDTDVQILGLVRDNMCARYSMNLFAIARSEKQYWQRIGKTEFKLGDVLLLQGKDINLRDAIGIMHCLPLAERGLNMGKS